MGTPNKNSILDTRVYKIEFTGSESAELATFFIADLLYTQHDAKGNEYLFLDVIINHQWDDKATSLVAHRN